MKVIGLVDNGSKRPEATVNLRRLAAALAERCGAAVYPVSLLHSDQIPPSSLGGEPAITLGPFLADNVRRGCREIILLPLFFGPSRAVTKFIPEQIGRVAREFADQTGAAARFRIDVADVLWKPVVGEPKLVDLLVDNVERAQSCSPVPATTVVLVDHGSPVPEVTKVRSAIAAGMRVRLGVRWEIVEAAMERRPGSQYDFSGPLLKDVLSDLSRSGSGLKHVVLAMLFLSPGRHAGIGGDVAEICDEARRQAPKLRLTFTPLVGEHPALVDILAKRLQGVHDRRRS